MKVQGLQVMKGSGVQWVERLENKMERRVLRAGKGTGQCQKSACGTGGRSDLERGVKGGWKEWDTRIRISFQ